MKHGTKQRLSRKGEGAVKKQRRKRAAQALAAAGAIAGGTYAYADPVRFDNPPHGEAGHFHWPGASAFGNVLDIALPAGDQPGSPYAPTTMGHYAYGYAGLFGSFTGLGQALRLQSTAENSMSFALGFTSGASIPNPSGGCAFYADPFCFSYYGFLHYPGYPSSLPEGVPVYLGTASGTLTCTYFDSCTYGWIGVVRTGAELEAFAWGHETLPGTPILAGAGGGVDPTGACCDDATGDCTEAVTQADCEGAGSRWGGDGSDCATIDPACVAPITGACCEDGTGICTEGVTEGNCPAPNEWTQDAACADITCNAIPTVSEWGLVIMGLTSLVMGTWMFRKQIQAT